MKLLERPLIKAVLKSIPFVGDIVSNMDNQSPQGEVDGRDSPYLIIRYLIIGVLIYLVLSGKIDIDQANDAKDLLN